MKTTLLAAAALVAVGALPAAAQNMNRCRVMDPTGTPLNVRTGPNATIVGTLPNGMLVSVRDQTRDRQGKLWVFVVNYETRQSIGWVYREFIACF